MQTVERLATIHFEDGRYRARYNGRILTSSTSKDYVINKIRSGACIKANDLGVTDVILDDGPVQGQTVSPVIESDEVDALDFGINQRFEFLETLVQMIIDKNIPSLLITGEGGLGKTHTVKSVIERNGLSDVMIEMAKAPKVAVDEDDEPVEHKNPGDYIFIKGFTTPKGVYRLLYENRDKIIVFDDCDAALMNPTAVNLIKAAADSYDDRWVSWHSEGLFGSDLPSSFRFEGQIIFISNMSYHKIDQAIRSRSMCVDLSMTTEQKIERMTKIAVSDSFMPEFSEEIKLDALNFLRDRQRMVRDMTLRSLISVIKIRAGGADNWAELAEYIVRTN